MVARLESYIEPSAGDVVVLAPGDIPTVDYYLTPRLQGLYHRRIDARSFDATAASVLQKGAFVVIVRHASRRWLQAVRRVRDRLSGVAYLMDDDIPAAWRCRDIPLDYGLWTSGRYWAVRDRLAQVCDRVWVSTSVLQARHPQAQLLPPLPYLTSRPPAPAGTRRWGYHGTRIHERELRWLLPVVEVVQKSVPQAEFEVFGGPKVARWFAHVPRVRVLPPLTWPDYVQHALSSNLAVGVAPLLAGKFNAARSYTKAFDILRCGAAGVFSARTPYTALPQDAAVLLPDETQAWAGAIIRLLRDDDARIERYQRMKAWADALTEQYAGQWRLLVEAGRAV